MSQEKMNWTVDAGLLIVEIVALPLLVAGAMMIALAGAVRRRFIVWLGGPYGHF